MYDECIKEMLMYTHDGAIMQCINGWNLSTTLDELDDIMLSEINQTQKENLKSGILDVFSYTFFSFSFPPSQTKRAREGDARKTVIRHSVHHRE